MADYRGGDAGRSGASQAAVHNISTGNTPGERARQLRQKLIQGVAEAGLTGLAGYINGEVGKDQENSAKRKIMASAIANAKKASAQQQGQMRDVRNSYPGGAEGPQAPENYGYTPKGGFSGPYQGYGTKSVEEAGKAGLDQDNTNKTAAGAPVTWGSTKQYTSAGMDDHAANSEIAGQDHAYLKNLSKSGQEMLDQVNANKSMLLGGPSVGGSPGNSGSDISHDNPYNIPTDGPAVNPELGNTSTGWAPTDEELSGMGQSKRGF